MKDRLSGWVGAVLIAGLLILWAGVSTSLGAGKASTSEVRALERQIQERCGP